MRQYQYWKYNKLSASQQVNKSTKINSFEIVWSKILEAIRAKNLDVSI